MSDIERRPRFLIVGYIEKTSWIHEGREHGGFLLNITIELQSEGPGGPYKLVDSIGGEPYPTFEEAAEVAKRDAGLKMTLLPESEWLLQENERVIVSQYVREFVATDKMPDKVCEDSPSWGHKSDHYRRPYRSNLVSFVPKG